MNTQEKKLENKLRMQLQRSGNLRLTKSRKRISIDNKGGYQIIDNNTNAVVDGLRYDLSLKDVEKFVNNTDRLEELYDKEMKEKYAKAIRGEKVEAYIQRDGITYEDTDDDDNNV